MELEIKGMTCNGCSSGVERAVGAMNGVTACDVNLATETAVIAFDEDVVTAEQVIERIEKMGYGVRRTG